MANYPGNFTSLLTGVPEWVHACSGTPLAIVFGCGPSLDAMPKKFWEAAGNYLTGCVNGFPILAPVIENGFTPDIWLAIDAIRDQDKKENYPGIRMVWESKKPQERPLRLMASANRNSTDSDLYFDHTTTWETERGYCKYGRSSVQALCHWLITEIGPEKIILFGVDYNGAGRAGGLEGNSSHQQGKKLEQVFSELYEESKKQGTEILNGSPGTGLKAIPAVDWTKFLCE